MNVNFTPGMRVVLKSRPEWGTGQVQSADGQRITVNFEHAGKKLILSDTAELTEINEK